MKTSTSPQSLDVIAVVALEAHLDREALPAFDGGGDILAAQAGLDDVEHGLGAQAVAGHRHAIHLDVEVGLALGARGGDAGGAGDFARILLHLEGLLLQGLEVVAENLHAHLGADAGAQHQDAAFDRVEKARHVARAPG